MKPLSWPKVPLGEILTPRVEKPTEDEILSGRVPIVDKISFDTGRISLRPGGATKTGMILVRGGDLLVSGINAAKGAIAIHEPGAQEVAATIHYSAYTVNPERADTRYLWWFLRSGVFREVLVERVPGGIKTELKAKRLLPLPVSLPPLHEQRRVVARLEEVAGRTQEARRLIETVDQTCHQILVTRLREEAVSADRTGRSVRLGEILVEAGYGTSQKCSANREDGSIPVLRIPNVTSERVNWTNLKFARVEGGRGLVSPGDILVVRTNGSSDLVGRCAVVEELREPAAFASYLIRLRLDVAQVRPDYVQLMLQLRRIEGKLVDFARTTAGQYNVSLGRLRQCEIPLPSISCQVQVVSRMNALQAELLSCEQVRRQVLDSLASLQPSLLRWEMR